MSDTLSRILSSGITLDKVQSILQDGISLEEIEDSVGRIQARGESAGEVEEENIEVRPADFSDVGNLNKFLELNEGRLLYTDSRGWLYWNGVCWIADGHWATKSAVKMSERMLEEAQIAYRQALHAQADAKAEGDKEAIDKSAEAIRREKAYFSHAMRTRTDRRIKAVLDLAKHFLAIDPALLDANPAELNTPAGIINLVTGELRPSDKTALCTMMTDCAPGKTGAALWIDFLTTITDGDGSLMGFLQQVAGMSLFGKVYHEGAVFAYGVGRNGKSTLFNTLAAVLGSYAGSIDISVLTTDRQNRGAALATLRGKRLVLSSELEEGKRLSVATLKQISSTDPITVEEKYLSPETILPTHTLVVSSNHLPRVGSRDEGTWRRILAVPFNARITNCIPNYGAKLVEEAGPAVLLWAIQGAVNFARNGYKLQTPDIVEEITEEYRDREDWLSNFLAECCIIEPEARAPAGELYKMYREWAEKNGDYVRRGVEFNSAMEGRGFIKRTPAGRKVWIGLRVNRETTWSA
ncbi:MAG: DNA primase family protein [Lawsonibacter sp.]|jgi:putative DNA primase/helicase